MTRLAPPLECQRLEPRDVPAIVGGFGAADLATRLFATGAPIGSDGVVTVFDSQSNFVGTIRPFGGTNLGVAVDVGDVNGDGVYDIVCGLGAGGRPRVEIYSGRGLGLIAQYDAFDPNFRGGVNVAVGNLDGDNRSEVIVGSGLGSFPIVRELEGLSGVERRAFFAFDLAFLGGVSVAVGAVNADTTPDIIAGAGPGGLPVVATFDSLTTQQLSARFAFDTAFRGGVLVAAGDVDGDRLTETIVGAGPGGVPVVRIFKGQALADTASFFAAPSTFTGGIAPLVFDISGSGVGTIYTAIGAGSNVVPRTRPPAASARSGRPSASAPRRRSTASRRPRSCGRIRRYFGPSPKSATASRPRGRSTSARCPPRR